MNNLYVRILFGGILVVLISVALITFRNLNSYTEEVRGIRHSNYVLRATAAILSSVRDAETGHRGYQLTRDTSYLEPYFNSLKALPSQLASLDSLLQGNPEQASRVDTLELVIENQFSIISQILSNARRSSLYMDRYESSLLAHGKDNMNEVRRVIHEITDLEEERVRKRISSESDFRTTTPISMLVYSLVALGAVTFLFTRTLDSLKKRDAAEKQLRDNILILKREALAREERELILREAETLANLGSWKWYGNPQSMIWSEGAKGIFGRVDNDYKPDWNSFLENCHSEDYEAVDAFIKDVRSSLNRTEVSYRIELDGKLKYLSLVAMPRVIGGKLIDILGTVQDVTDQKVYEIQLKQFTAELQRSNQDLEQFAYVASHDLQEPLRKIRAFGDRLTSKYQSKLEEQGADYVLRMQSAAARMQSLIEELLSFSRVSRPGIVSENLSVDEIIAEIVEDLELQIRREKATIKASSIPPIKGERSQIKRLLQNLISNGIKFHKSGKSPTLEISGKVVKGSEVLTELNVQMSRLEYVWIEVKDDGIGFDEKYLEKIFNIFQRLHGRTEYEGTGIGLAICRKIVINHGGYITARSKENVGSVFIVILPVD